MERGTGEVLDAIVREHGDAMVRLGFLYLRDLHLAQDAVQDTLVSVYRHYGGFRGESGLKTWVFRILVNTLKNYRRSNWWRRIDPGSALESIPAREDGPDDDALLLAVMALPEKYRQAVLLHYYQGFKVREIAKVLGCPESTVAVRLKRARERLRTALKGEFDDEEDVAGSD